MEYTTGIADDVQTLELTSSLLETVDRRSYSVKTNDNDSSSKLRVNIYPLGTCNIISQERPLPTRSKTEDDQSHYT